MYLYGVRELVECSFEPGKSGAFRAKRVPEYRTVEFQRRNLAAIDVLIERKKLVPVVHSDASPCEGAFAATSSMEIPDHIAWDTIEYSLGPAELEPTTNGL